ncbi:MULTISPECIES: hypothetical protein [Acinetobacter]|uniref:Uncharacterized protein n=1 Tax=Acinetobacter higginsii TaxID=70347 RepID=N9SYM9_9GAMM|nr:MULTISPECIES: hypothetical protein [Acinetobacter]ENX56170.1 hypothetical protein F902_03267 [Acinetobacter higginsii]
MSNTRRQVQTPGKTAEQVQPEASISEVVVDVDASPESQQSEVVEQPLAAEQVQQVEEPPLDGEPIDLALIIPAILESLHRIEELIATGSLSTPVAAKPKKGRFKFIEGKGHVWVEG